VKPFVCRFAVGRDGLAYSSDWRIWTHKNKPDLYIAIRQLGGELKASVHAPHPPHHTGWRRHLGFQKDATSIVSKQAKQDGGPHKVQWPGCEIGPDTTVEYRVIIRGMSLEETGRPVDHNVELLPMPSRDEYVEVYCILGPMGSKRDYPRERDGETYLLREGRLSDDRQAWVVYIIRPIKKEATPIGPVSIELGSSFIDPDADLTSPGLRAVTFGTQPDGSLAFWEWKRARAQTSHHGG
jgi:hypothetical protein